MIKSRLLYIGIIIAAFVFSQALYDPISLFTLVCILLLPIVSLITMLIGAATLKVRTKMAKTDMVRFEKQPLRCEIKCAFPLLSPVLCLSCLLPDTEGLGVTKQKLFVRFSPFSRQIVEFPITFTRRGTYRVGVTQVEICDFLRLFRIRKTIKPTYVLRVKPRVLPCDLRMQQRVFMEDSSTSDMFLTEGYSTDLFGVRDFVDSDSLRQVHWNLSAQMDHLIVKTYAQSRQQQVHLWLDLSFETVDEVSRRFGDAMVETALSVARHLMNAVGIVQIFWTGGGTHHATVQSPEQFSNAYASLVRCPIHKEGKLQDMVSQIGSAQELCIVVGKLTEQKLHHVEYLQESLHSRIQVFTFEKEDEVSVDHLAAKGIHLSMLNLQEIEKGRIV